MDPVFTPERPSAHEKLTVTGTLFHPFEFGGTDLAVAIVGGVRSIWMLPTVEDARLPALSTQVPVTD